jgi:hypothetical protein
MFKIQFGQYNKATAAVISQALVQLAANFMTLPPDVEQAAGTLLTAALVWLVPNRSGNMGKGPKLPFDDRGLFVAHLPVFAMAAAALLAVMVAAGPATAQSAACGPRPAVIQKVTEEFGETRALIGLTARGEVLELYSTIEGQWTLIATRPDGISCVIAIGSELEITPPAASAGPQNPT